MGDHDHSEETTAAVAQQEAPADVAGGEVQTDDAAATSHLQEYHIYLMDSEQKAQADFDKTRQSFRCPAVRSVSRSRFSTTSSAVGRMTRSSPFTLPGHAGV